MPADGAPWPRSPKMRPCADRTNHHLCRDINMLHVPRGDVNARSSGAHYVSERDTSAARFTTSAPRHPRSGPCQTPPALPQAIAPPRLLRLPSHAGVGVHRRGQVPVRGEGARVAGAGLPLLSPAAVREDDQPVDAQVLPRRRRGCREVVRGDRRLRRRGRDGTPRTPPGRGAEPEGRQGRHVAGVPGRPRRRPAGPGRALAFGLATLIERVAAGRGRPFVLIDEYDSALHAAWAGGFVEDAVLFFRTFFGASLKDNAHLDRAVLTGILRMAQESIFSDLNNLSVDTVLDREYATDFGFTDEEVTALLPDDRARVEELRAWYDGYLFGEERIYNPWSIASALARPESRLPRLRPGTARAGTSRRSCALQPRVGRRPAGRAPPSRQCEGASGRARVQSQ